MNTPHTTWSDSWIHEQIRDAGLDPVNLATNDTPTPDTDEALSTAECESDLVIKMRRMERERDAARETLAELRASVLDLSHPNIKMILSERDEAREYADKLAEGLPEGMLPKDVEVLREANLNLATELTAVTEQRDEAREKIEFSREWSAAIADIADDLRSELAAVTEQRDRLAEAVNAATILIPAKGRHNTMLAYEGLRDALKYLTPKP
jgi:chromosome segregation ATPase